MDTKDTGEGQCGVKDDGELGKVMEKFTESDGSGDRARALWRIPPHTHRHGRPQLRFGLRYLPI